MEDDVIKDDEEIVDPDLELGADDELKKKDLIDEDTESLEDLAEDELDEDEESFDDVDEI